MATLYWSPHFKKRLLERFNISLTKNFRKKVTEAYENTKPFARMAHRKGGCAKVYKILENDKEVMILIGENRIVISAYRRNWFSRDNSGEYKFSWKQVNNAKKANKRLKNEHKKLRREKLIKLLCLLYCDNKPCLI